MQWLQTQTVTAAPPPASIADANLEAPSEGLQGVKHAALPEPPPPHPTAPHMANSSQGKEAELSHPATTLQNAQVGACAEALRCEAIQDCRTASAAAEALTEAQEAQPQHAAAAQPHASAPQIYRAQDSVDMRACCPEPVGECRAEPAAGLETNAPAGNCTSKPAEAAGAPSSFAGSLPQPASSSQAWQCNPMFDESSDSDRGTLAPNLTAGRSSHTPASLDPTTAGRPAPPSSTNPPQGEGPELTRPAVSMTVAAAEPFSFHDDARSGGTTGVGAVVLGQVEPQRCSPPKDHMAMQGAAVRRDLGETDSSFEAHERECEGEAASEIGREPVAFAKPQGAAAVEVGGRPPRELKAWQRGTVWKV